MEKNLLPAEEDIRPEMKDDIYDPSYKDKEGPRPKLEYVWRNIILMSLLHLGALYGIILIPTCKFYTWLWGKSVSRPPDPRRQVLSTLEQDRSLPGTEVLAPTVSERLPSPGSRG